MLRALEGIAARDWLPNGAPDGVLELDTSKIVYRGVSFGAHHSLGFLPFAPEVTAAVEVVGGGRVFENTLHQLDFYDAAGAPGRLAGAAATILLVGLAALQNDTDREDPIFLARHLYRDPLPISGQPISSRPSLLWLEGIGDSIVSNNATRAAARRARASPRSSRVKGATSFLPLEVRAALRQRGAGRDRGTLPVPPALHTELCRRVPARGALLPAASRARRPQQILHFFATAAAGAAEIVNPLP